MFKVESYITPFIVSYVDKYVKNIKPEDSRVSALQHDDTVVNMTVPGNRFHYGAGTLFFTIWI